MKNNVEEKKAAWQKACREYFEGHAGRDVCRACPYSGNEYDCEKCKYYFKHKDRAYIEWKKAEEQG